jgi:predicted  nucleic acid-binding Zn-ribbon protein
MGSDNKNNNELVVADDDPTAELETLLIASTRVDLPYREADASTYDASDEFRSDAARRDFTSKLELDLLSRNKTVAALQFDIEQLRSRLLGLETEIETRSSRTRQLVDDLEAQRDTVVRKEQLLRKRDRKIRALKTEIRQREKERRTLASEFASVDRSTSATKLSSQTIAETATKLQTNSTKELVQRLTQAEEYGDTLRWRLQEAMNASSHAEAEEDYLQHRLHDSLERISSLEQALQSAESGTSALHTTLEGIETQHQTEIHLLRFELGAAQETLTESDGQNSQLTAELIVAREHRDDLQNSMFENEKATQREISELEKELQRLNRTTLDLEQELSTKSDAITALLAEFAKRSSRDESIGNIHDPTRRVDVVEDFDNAKRSNTDRLSRVLVGTIDGQVLRFPLFKDQVTIGRTEDNDIQLKAAHISRRHAVVQTDGDTTRIIDWGSKNGVFVNATRISEHFLCNGDLVTIGNAKFRYEERKKRDL